jgi:hypothetical protein
VPCCNSFQLLLSKDGALRSFDSSMFNTRLCAPIAPLAAVLELLDPRVEELLDPVQLWLKSCQGTATNLPIELLSDELLGVPVTLDRLEGTVSRPDVDVSEAPPPEAKERMANSIRPLCGSTVRSRICPSVLPSCPWTDPFMIWLSRSLLPECIWPEVEPRLLELEPRLLELDPRVLEFWLLDPRLLELWLLGLVFRLELDDEDCCASTVLPVREIRPLQIILVTLSFFIFSLLVLVL